MPKADDPVTGPWSVDGWIDISRPLRPGTPVWPGDRPFEVVHHTNGDVVVSAVTTTLHVGTHIDTPRHLGPEGATVEDLPLNRLIGPAEVVQLSTGCREAAPADLPRNWVPRFPRVLLRTDSHPVDAPIAEGFCALTAELVGWLAVREVCTVGIDTPSVDVFSSEDLEAHRALARHGMTWVEGLDLHGVDPGTYLLVALPMPLHGVEAAPVRALLQRLGDLDS